MDLLKEINDTIRTKDPVAVAITEVDSSTTQKEVGRLADHWRTKKKDMSPDDLKEEIGNELEQLEYSPSEIERLVPKILKLVNSK